jgi:rRNA maturation protein Nop10
MGKRYKLRKIKAKRSYTFKELSEVLGVHVRTVQEWHVNGLTPLEGSCSPYLVMGAELKRYLTNKVTSSKVVLLDGEFFCFHCRKAVMPSDVQAISKGVKVGGFKMSIRLASTCPLCGGKINKFTAKEQSQADGVSNTVGVLECPRED